MATVHSPATMVIYRLKYLDDAEQLAGAKAVFIQWARVAMIHRKIDARSASRVGVQALTAWVGDVCHACKGRKYKVLEGTPTLSGKPCAPCKGTGKNQIKASGEIGEVMKDIAERADSAIQTLQSSVNYKIGRGFL